MRVATQLSRALAAAILLAAASHARADIRIGAVLSVTGPAAYLGEPEKKTLEIYAADINAKGGVNGHKITLIVYDDAGNPNQTRIFGTRLIENDKVDALLAGTTTATALALIPLAEKVRVPLINFAGAVQAVSPVRRYVFKTPHTDLMACEKIFEDLKQRGLTRIAMISGLDAFGVSMRGHCQSLTALYGIEVLHEENYSPGDGDVTAQLAAIKATPGIQAVINPGFGKGPATVSRNYRQLGIALPLYQSHGVGSKQYIELAGAAAEGVRLPAAALLVADKLPDSDPQKKVLMDYKTLYEQKTGQPVSSFGGHAYDGLMILLDALRRAGSSDSAKLRDAIETTRDFIGTGGVVNMTAADHLGLDLTAMRMLEIRNGDWTLVSAPGG
jgi:branched-chain amino acid transport system substrate-binding protein